MPILDAPPGTASTWLDTQGAPPRPRAPNRPYPPVLVGIPALAWSWTVAAAGWMQLANDLPAGSDVLLLQGLSCPATARNMLVQIFLEQTKYDWLLCLDADVTVPRGIAQRLLGHGRDVVSTILCSREPPHTPWVQNLEPKNTAVHPSELQAVKDTAFGCVLLSRKVLAAVGRPWFRSSDQLPGAGEDTDFFARVRAQGYTVWLDPVPVLGHLTPIGVTHMYSSWFRSTHRAAAAPGMPAA